LPARRSLPGKPSLIAELLPRKSSKHASKNLNSASALLHYFFPFPGPIHLRYQHNLSKFAFVA